MTDNQTFPILNVITENLRLSHGHLSVVPLRKGKGVERSASESANQLRSVKQTAVINTRGTSFGVERNCSKFQQISSDCTETFGKFSRTSENSDARQHYCVKHRNSLQEGASATLAEKNSNFDGLDNFANLNGSTVRHHVNYERHAACSKTQIQGYDPAAKGRFDDQRATRTREGFVSKDVVGVNCCRCGHTTQQILCGAVGLRSGNVPSDASRARSSFPINGESILPIRTGTTATSKIVPSGPEGRHSVSQNLWHKKSEVHGSDALHFPLNSSAWKPDAHPLHVAEKLQSTMIIWWR